MKKLFIYISIITVCSLAVTATASWIMNKGLKKSKVDFFGKMNSVGMKDDYDILLIGSSRTLVQINPRIIDSATGLSSVNLGLNGATIKTCYNIIQYAVNNKSRSRIAIVNIDYNMFDMQNDPYKDAFFYPYESDIPDLVRTDTGKAGWIHDIKLFDVSLYDDMAKYSAIDGILRPGRLIAGSYKGYVPSSDGNFDEPSLVQIKKRPAPFKESELQTLRDLIRFCIQNQVKPVLVVAPYSRKYFPGNYISNYSIIINKVRDLAAETKTAFWDFSMDPIGRNNEFFYNVNHLNKAGADAYSKKLANLLNSIL